MWCGTHCIDSVFGAYELLLYKNEEYNESLKYLVLRSIFVLLRTHHSGDEGVPVRLVSQSLEI